MSDSIMPETYARDLERSYESFRRALAYLEPEEQHRSCLPDGWTPAAMVAHVAYWDNYQRRRMEAALTGAWAEEMPAHSESNDARAVNDAHLDWEVVLQDADQARQALVTFARSVTPAQIEAVYREGGKERPVLKILLGHMSKHAREHAATIARYCGSMDRWGRAGLRAFLIQQQKNFLDVISGLSEQTCAQVSVCGNWSVRDVLAHVLTWDEYTYQVVKQWPEVPMASLSPWIEGEEDEVNARLMAAKADWGMIDLLDGLVTVHRRILRRYDTLSDEALAAEAEYGWGMRDTAVGFLYSMSIHTAEHAAELWEARIHGHLVPVAV